MQTTYPNEPGFKIVGTSAQAAHETKPRAEILRTRCLAAIREHHGLTSDETSAKLGESVLAVRPRLSELRALGKISDSGTRRKNDSGKSANVWVATALFD